MIGSTRLRDFPTRERTASVRPYRLPGQPHKRAEYPAGSARFRPCARPLLSSARFPGPRARAVTRFLFARPPPGIGDTQGVAFRRHDIGGMQVQAALGLVGERTKAGNTLLIEVQFGAVLPAKNDRALPPPGKRSTNHSLYRGSVSCLKILRSRSLLKYADEKR